VDTNEVEQITIASLEKPQTMEEALKSEDAKK
jgi:hypothetical protein